MGREIVFDIEGDNLFPAVDNIWIIVMKSVCGEVIEKFYPYIDLEAGDKFINVINDGDTIIGHNILGYDFWAIMKKMGIYFDSINFTLSNDSITKSIDVCDTLCLSRFVAPDQHEHSLEYYGKKFGDRKIDFNDFSAYSEAMETYCIQDVNLNIKVYRNLKRDFDKMYQGSTKGLSSFAAYQKDYYLMTAQGFTGVLFDIELGNKTLASIQKDKEDIRANIEPLLPKRKLKKGEEKFFSMPAKPFKKDGSIAASLFKFVDKISASGMQCTLNEQDLYIIVDGNNYDIQSGFMLPVQMPMTLGNQDDLKEWFLEIGWNPTFFNYQKDSQGNLIRENGKLTPTTPKLQEQGKLCPNLSKIDFPLVKDIIKWLSLRNRESVLTNWLANERLKVDGRISSSSTGTTPTYRHKHSTVVNVPKAQVGVLYGKEFRGLFIVPEDCVMVGADASGLEARVDGHYCAKNDGGKRAKLILEGDIHSNNAKLFYPEETKNFDINAQDFDKEHPDFKPYRSKSKNAAYALAYGCAPKKLAETLGKPLSLAEPLYQAFWDGNPALKAIKEACSMYWKSKGNKKYLLGIDGRLITTRKESALVNSLFQSCGAIIMGYSAIIMNEKLGGLKFDEKFLPYYEYKGYTTKRVLYFHDEFQYECHPDIAEEIGKMLVDSIKEAGVQLGLRIELDGDYNIGSSWATTH